MIKFHIRGIKEKDYKKIREIAEREKRSINNQLLIMIEKQLEIMLKEKNK